MRIETASYCVIYAKIVNVFVAVGEMAFDTNKNWIYCWSNRVCGDVSDYVKIGFVKCSLDEFLSSSWFKIKLSKLAMPFSHK